MSGNLWDCICGEERIDFEIHPFTCPGCGQDVREGLRNSVAETVAEIDRVYSIPTHLLQAERDSIQIITNPAVPPGLALAGDHAEIEAALAGRPYDPRKVVVMRSEP